MGVELDVAADIPPNQRHEVVDLRWRCHTDRVREADPIHAGAIDRAIDANQVGGVASEGVLGAETGFQPGATDLADHFGSDGDDLVDAHAVRDGPESGGRGDEHIDTVDAGVDRDTRVVEAATHVREEAKGACHPRHLAEVGLRLRRSDRRRELHVIDAESIERGCDRELLLDREMGERELFALSERAVDDAKRGDAHVFRMCWWTKEKSPFEEGALRGI